MNDKIKDLLKEEFQNVSTTTNGDLFLQVHDEDDSVSAMDSMRRIAVKIRTSALDEVEREMYERALKYLSHVQMNFDETKVWNDSMKIRDNALSSVRSETSG